MDKHGGTLLGINQGIIKLRAKISIAAVLGLVLTGFVSSPASSGENEALVSSNNFLSNEVVSTNQVVSTQSVGFTFLPVDENGDALSNDQMSFANLILRDQTTNDFIDAEYVEYSGSAVTVQLDDDSYYELDFRVGNTHPTLSNTIYQITTGTGTISSIIRSADSAPATTSGNVYQVQMLEANVTFEVMNPDGSSITIPDDYSEYYEAEVFNQNGSQIQDPFFQEFGTTQFAIYIPTAGTYRIKYRAFGRNDVAAAFTREFTITQGMLDGTESGIDLEQVNLNEPQLLIEARAQGSTDPVPRSQIHILKDVGNGEKEFIEGLYMHDGVGALSFESAGSYTLELRPPWGTAGFTKTLFSVTVSDDGNGNLSAVVDGLTTETNSDGDQFYALEFGTPNVQGVVLDPDGNPLANSQVVPFRISDGMEMWELSANSSDEGLYSIDLPAGDSYNLIARPNTWEGQLFGRSDPVGPIVVDQSGNVTQAPGGDADNVSISLKAPTWSGTIVSPTDQTPVADSNICIVFSNTDYSQTCASTGLNGEWAITAPEGFQGFDASSELWAESHRSEDLSALRLNGKDEIESLLGTYTPGQTYSDIDVALAEPNFEITVTAAGDAASDVEVWVDSDFGYIGGARTNENGVAKLRIETEETQVRLRINSDVSRNSTLKSVFTGSREEIAANTLQSVDGIYSYSFQLEQANFAGFVLTPATDDESPQPAGYANVEAFDASSDRYVQWMSSDSEGFFTGNLPADNTYRITVRPPWNSDGDIAEANYEVVVDSSGDVTSVTDQGSTALTGTTDSDTGLTTYDLLLSAANVTGSVKDGSGNGVRHSWVEVRDSDGDYIRDKGAPTKAQGQFSMRLDSSAQYDLIAQAPWNSSQVRSAACSVEIDGSGNVDVSNSDSACVNSDGLVTLDLRDGNFTVNTKDSNNDSVAFADLNMSIGNWYSHARSDANGVAQFFVDMDEVRAMNRNVSTPWNIEIRLYAPWGSSNLVSWECDSQSAEGCVGTSGDGMNEISNSTLTTEEFGNRAVEATFPDPNTSFSVTAPNGEGGADSVANAWVSVLVDNNPNDQDDYFEWVAGAHTDANGVVVFNLPDTSDAVRYRVDTNAPWGDQDKFSGKNYEVLWSALDGEDFSLGIPNLVLDISTADDASEPASWSWVGVEEVDNATNLSPIAWVGGANVDRAGVGSLNLESNKTFKLRIHPGRSAHGSITTCFVTVDGSGDVSPVTDKCPAGTFDTQGSKDKLTMQLSAGNLDGKVKLDSSTNNSLDGKGVEGAIVVATLYDSSDTVLEQVETVSRADGTYALQLDPAGSGENWLLTAYHAGVTEDDFELDNVTTGIPVTVGQSKTTKDITLTESVAQ